MRAAIGNDVSGQLALDANALTGLKAQAKNAPEQALSKAAGQFEALFLQMLLKSMRESLPQDGPLASDTSKTYTGMLDQQLAQTMSKKGLGIADMLVKQLSPTLKRAAVDKSAAASQPAAQPRAIPTKATASAPPLASTPQGFIDKLRPHAEAVARAVGVPAQFLLGQAGLETGWGKSQPKSANGASSHNLFGVKAGKSWKGAVVEATTTEYIGGKTVKTVERFRSYASYTEAFQDFAALLRGNQRYANALASARDAGSYATNMQRAGYATDPQYAAKLAHAIQTVARHSVGTRAAPAGIQVLAPRADNHTTRA